MIAVFLCTFLVLMLLGGLPIGYAVLASAISIPLLFSGATYTLSEVANWSTISAISSTASTGATILFFIISGNVMAYGGLTEKIFDTLAYHLGRKRGFMPIVSILTCMFYSAISGSAPATTAAVGAMCYPILISLGYDKIFSAAILCCGGCLGMVIPPSVPLAYAVGATVNFTGTELQLTPAYLLAAVFGCFCGVVLIIYAYIYCKRHKADEEKIIEMNDMLHQRSFGVVLKESIWAMAAPFIILGTIFTGVADTLEAGAISVVYALFVSLVIYKSMTMENLLQAIIKSLKSAAPLLSMLTLANCFNGAMQALNIPTLMADYLTNAGFKVTMVVIVVLIMMLIMGMFMDGGGALGILLPLGAPLVQTMGGELYSFVVALVMCQAVGQLTPPFGMCLFTMCSISGDTVPELSKKVLPIAGLFALISITVGVFPVLSAWAVP